MPDNRGPERLKSSPEHIRRLWAVLIVIDIALIVIFGAALAARIYYQSETESLSTKLPAPVKSLSGTPPLADQAPRTLGTIQAPAPSARLRAPAAGLKGRMAPLAPAAKASRDSVSTPKKEVTKRKGRPKAKKVTFRYRNNRARKVSLTGGFIRWRRKPMKKRGGEWKLTLWLMPENYRYQFVIDGKRIPDPENPLREKNFSILAVSPD